MVCSIAAASGSIELSVIEIFEKISWIHSKNDNFGLHVIRHEVSNSGVCCLKSTIANPVPLRLGSTPSTIPLNLFLWYASISLVCDVLVLL